jgi:cytochrome b561
MRKGGELIGSLFLFLLGVLFTIEARRIPIPILQQDINTTPSFFPFVVGIVFSTLALFHIVQSVVRTGGTVIDQGPRVSPLKRRMAVAILAVILFYIICMQIIGWLLSSFFMVLLVITFTSKALQMPLHLTRTVVIAGAFSAGVFFLFDYLLGVPLPAGIWSIESVLLGK